MKRKKHYDIDEYNISINNYNGIFQIMANNLVVPFATIFAKRLDASDFQVALISSLPAIVSIGVIIPGAVFIQKCFNKQKVTGLFFIASRLFYLLFAFVPFFAGQYRASLFVLLYGFMNLPGSIALMSWQSFVAGLFPPSLRASAMASRNKLSTLIGVLTTLLTGWLLYSIPKSDNERIVLYQFFFAAAFIIACIEVYTFYKHKKHHREDCAALEPLQKAHAPSITYNNWWSEIRANKRFLSFCLCAFSFHFAWYLAWPLFSLYEIDYLHSDEIWTSIISAVAASGSALSYPYWGRLVNKIGNELPLAIAVLLMGTGPVFYPMSNSLYMVLPINFLNAMGYAGIMLIFLNTVYELAPEENRVFYIACFNTMTGILLATAPILGIAVKNTFGIHIALTISGFLRIFSALLFFIRYKKGRHL